MKGDKQEIEREENNPFYFDEHCFQTALDSENGNIRILQMFSERSGLPKALDNYRIATLEANPHTFMIPHHSDANSVFIITQGQGKIIMVHQEYRECFNMRQGDAMKIPVGSNVYLINSNNNEKLKSVILYQPINIPGLVQQFISAGGQDPYCFYRAFSNELLEAALNVPREKYDRVFGTYNSGILVKATEEQINELIQDKGQGGISLPGEGGESKSPFNLLQQPPLLSNNFGEFFEATPDTHEQLKELNVSVDIMNIKKGAMIVPHFNTTSTKMVAVIEGNGYFEILHPQPNHVSPYQRVSARFSVGDVFIIPAGLPVSIVSSSDENLQLVGFGINARYSYKHFLAGSVNIWNQVPPVAKELSFAMQATEVDEVFESQLNSFFVPGPNQAQ